MIVNMIERFQNGAQIICLWWFYGIKHNVDYKYNKSKTCLTLLSLANITVSEGQQVTWMVS